MFWSLIAAGLAGMGVGAVLQMFVEHKRSRKRWAEIDLTRRRKPSLEESCGAFRTSKGGYEAPKNPRRAALKPGRANLIKRPYGKKPVNPNLSGTTRNTLYPK